MSIVTLTAPGITCGGCARRVTNALQGQPGISNMEVKVGGAVVEFDPTVTSVDEIKAKVESVGYAVAAVNRLARLDSQGESVEQEDA